MSLLLKVKKVKLDDIELYCVIDMKTIATFKQLTGESFLKAIQRIGDMDDMVMINLLASSLRETPDGDPVGLDYLSKYNPLALITELMEDVAELIQDSMPKEGPGVTSKKKKK